MKRNTLLTLILGFALEQNRSNPTTKKEGGGVIDMKNDWKQVFPAEGKQGRYRRDN